MHKIPLIRVPYWDLEDLTLKKVLSDPSYQVKSKYHIDDLVDSLSPKFSNLFGYDTAVREFTEFYDGRKDKQTYSNEFTK